MKLVLFSDLKDWYLSPDRVFMGIDETLIKYVINSVRHNPICKSFEHLNYNCIYAPKIRLKKLKEKTNSKRN